MKTTCYYVPCVLILIAASSTHADDAVDTSRGDALLADYFEREVSRIEESTFADIETLEDWTSRREEYHQQLMYMLGLDPLPERTELHPVITGRIDHPEMIVENLHFQSLPGLYVTGNLYIPKGVEGPRPTILYVCGHGGVNIDGIDYGNKVHYQHHGEWFARNGYVCLTIDTIQLGEIQGLHHGNYREGMWWWYSRGYTPAGVEAWNCMRALDYLETRPEVDSRKFGVTGRSGGGAYSWWIAAIDERIQCAVPVAGITSLRNHVIDGCIEGHCDCMYMINTFAWDFPMVAALVAPRPLLISNSDKDGIFPLDGVYDVYTKVRSIYELYDAEENLGLNITEGPHSDTQPLQVAAFEWMNRHLRGSNVIIDRAATPLFIPQELKVFDQLPDDERVTTAHNYFVPMAKPSAGTGGEQLHATTSSLRELTFRGWPRDESVSAVSSTESATVDNLQVSRIQRQEFELFRVSSPLWVDDVLKIELMVLTQTDWDFFHSALAYGVPELISDLNGATPDKAAWDAVISLVEERSHSIYFLPPRGIGPSQWNRDERAQTHVRRRFMLVGQTADGMRVWDVLTACRSIREQYSESRVTFTVHGSEEAAVWTLYAGLMDAAEYPRRGNIDRLVLTDLPASHMDPDCPELLNVLRITDIPQVVDLLSEFREVELLNSDDE